MTERRVDLNLNTPTMRQDDLARQPGRHERGAADEQDRERFERSLAGDGAKGEENGRARPEAMPASPFALFGGGGGQVAGGPRDATDDSARRASGSGLERLPDMLDRLMVGEGGAGGKIVRMALSDDLLPGVSISVSEFEGGWLVECECRDDDSRERLCAQLRELASEMAERTGRVTLWRVTTDDPEDLRPVEARATPEGGS